MKLSQRIQHFYFCVHFRRVPEGFILRAQRPYFSQILPRNSVLITVSERLYFYPDDSSLAQVQIIKMLFKSMDVLLEKGVNQRCLFFFFFKHSCAMVVTVHGHVSIWSCDSFSLILSAFVQTVTSHNAMQQSAGSSSVSTANQQVTSGQIHWSV